MATNRLDQRTAEQVEKGDVHDTNNDDAIGGSTEDSGSGATKAERAVGRAEADTNGRVPSEVRAVAPETERLDAGSPTRG